MLLRRLMGVVKGVVAMRQITKGAALADVLSGGRNEQAGAAVGARARGALVGDRRHRRGRHRLVIDLALLTAAGQPATRLSWSAKQD